MKPKLLLLALLVMLVLPGLVLPVMADSTTTYMMDDRVLLGQRQLDLVEVNASGSNYLTTLNSTSVYTHTDVNDSTNHVFILTDRQQPYDYFDNPEKIPDDILAWFGTHYVGVIVMTIFLALCALAIAPRRRF